MNQDLLCHIAGNIILIQVEFEIPVKNALSINPEPAGVMSCVNLQSLLATQNLFVKSHARTASIIINFNNL